MNYYLHSGDIMVIKQFIHIVERTRMWANAQRDACLPNIGGTLCSTPQSVSDAHY